MATNQKIFKDYENWTVTFTKYDIVIKASDFVPQTLLDQISEFKVAAKIFMYGLTRIFNDKVGSKSVEESTKIINLTRDNFVVGKISLRTTKSAYDKQYDRYVKRTGKKPTPAEIKLMHKMFD